MGREDLPLERDQQHRRHPGPHIRRRRLAHVGERHHRHPARGRDHAPRSEHLPLRGLGRPAEPEGAAVPLRRPRGPNPVDVRPVPRHGLGAVVADHGHRPSGRLGRGQGRFGGVQGIGRIAGDDRRSGAEGGVEPRRGGVRLGLGRAQRAIGRGPGVGVRPRIPRRPLHAQQGEGGGDHQHQHQQQAENGRAHMAGLVDRVRRRRRGRARRFGCAAIASAPRPAQNPPA